MGSANRCEACERADVIVRGAKCAMHEHATSPRIDRATLERAMRDRPGPIGPVPFVLAGGDLATLPPKMRTEIRARALAPDVPLIVDEDGEWYLAATTSIDGRPLEPFVAVPARKVGT